MSRSTSSSDHPVLDKKSGFPFSIKPTFEGETELDVGLPPPMAAVGTAPLPRSPVDLKGKAKVWFVIGSGRSGKTTFLRWTSEICANGGSYPIMAAVDPGKRSLANYIDGVAVPPTNDAAATARWLEALMLHTMAEKTSACVDFGGGDTSLQKLLTTLPDLIATLQAAGIESVAIYPLGPRVDDLASLATFEKLGFQPAATALICNEGLSDPMIDREDAFARVRRHSVYRAAAARGAAGIWMPRLDAAVAQELEAKRLGFIQGRDGKSPEGRDMPPLGGFDRSKLRMFLTRMEHENSPIASWLP